MPSLLHFPLLISKNRAGPLPVLRLRRHSPVLPIASLPYRTLAGILRKVTLQGITMFISSFSFLVKKQSPKLVETCVGLQGKQSNFFLNQGKVWDQIGRCCSLISLRWTLLAPVNWCPVQCCSDILGFDPVAKFPAVWFLEGWTIWYPQLYTSGE